MRPAVTMFDRLAVESAAAGQIARRLGAQTQEAHERREAAAYDAERQAWLAELQRRTPELQAIRDERQVKLEALIVAGVRDFDALLAAWRDYRSAAICAHESLNHVTSRLNALSPQYNRIGARVDWMPDGLKVDESPWQYFGAVVDAATKNGLRDMAMAEADARTTRIEAAKNAARLAVDHSHK